MKRLLLFILGGGLIALATVFVTLQLKTKKLYDEATEFFQKISVTSTEATEEDNQLIATITRDWVKHEELGMPPQDLENILYLARFPNTLSGLVAFQTHVAPPYSYFDHQRNRIEAIRAATMNIGSPIGKGELVVSSSYVYHKQNSGLVHLFTMSDKGIQHIIFMKPKEAEAEAPDRR